MIFSKYCDEPMFHIEYEHILSGHTMLTYCCYKGLFVFVEFLLNGIITTTPSPPPPPPPTIAPATPVTTLHTGGKRFNYSANPSKNNRNNRINRSTRGNRNKHKNNCGNDNRNERNNYNHDTRNNCNGSDFNDKISVRRFHVNMHHCHPVSLNGCLHFAVLSDSINIIKLLLKHDCDPLVKNLFDLTAPEYALILGFTNSYQILSQYMTQPAMKKIYFYNLKNSSNRKSSILLKKTKSVLQLASSVNTVNCNRGNQLQHRNNNMMGCQSCHRLRLELFQQKYTSFFFVCSFVVVVVVVVLVAACIVSCFFCVLLFFAVVFLSMYCFLFVVCFAFDCYVRKETEFTEQRLICKKQEILNLETEIRSQKQQIAQLTRENKDIIRSIHITDSNSQSPKMSKTTMYLNGLAPAAMPKLRKTSSSGSSCTESETMSAAQLECMAKQMARLASGTHHHNRDHDHRRRRSSVHIKQSKTRMVSSHGNTEAASLDTFDAYGAADDDDDNLIHFNVEHDNEKEDGSEVVSENESDATDDSIEQENGRIRMKMKYGDGKGKSVPPLCGQFSFGAGDGDDGNINDEVENMPPPLKLSSNVGIGNNSTSTVVMNVSYERKDSEEDGLMMNLKISPKHDFDVNYSGYCSPIHVDTQSEKEDENKNVMTNDISIICNTNTNTIRSGYVFEFDESKTNFSDNNSEHQIENENENRDGSERHDEIEFSSQSCYSHTQSQTRNRTRSFADSVGSINGGSINNNTNMSSEESRWKIFEESQLWRLFGILHYRTHYYTLHEKKTSLKLKTMIKDQLYLKQLEKLHSEAINQELCIIKPIFHIEKLSHFLKSLVQTRNALNKIFRVHQYSHDLIFYGSNGIGKRISGMNMNLISANNSNNSNNNCKSKNKREKNRIKNHKNQMGMRDILYQKGILQLTDKVYNWHICDYQQLWSLQEYMFGKYNQWLIDLSYKLYQKNVICCLKSDFKTVNNKNHNNSIYNRKTKYKYEITPQMSQMSKYKRLQKQRMASAHQQQTNGTDHNNVNDINHVSHNHNHSHSRSHSHRRGSSFTSLSTVREMTSSDEFGAHNMPNYSEFEEFFDLSNYVTHIKNSDTFWLSHKDSVRTFFKIFYDYNGQISNITDFLRASLVFDNFEDMYNALLIINEFCKEKGCNVKNISRGGDGSGTTNGGNNNSNSGAGGETGHRQQGILRYKNSFDKSKDNGWRQILINFELNDSIPIICELQLHFALFWEWKDVTHDMHEISRLFKVPTQDGKSFQNLALDCAKEFFDY